MSDRKLVVYEADPADPDKYRLVALDPNRATGIPIPAFRPVTVLPAAGSQVGEGVLNTTNHQSYIWDGGTWVNIVPPTILTYATEAILIADLAPAVGSHAFAQDTGNLFVLVTGTPNNYWRQIGLRVFAVEADLLAATAMDGERAFALDTQKSYIHINGAWRHDSVEFMTHAQALLETPSAGRVIFSTDTADVLFASGANWHSVAADVYHRSATYSKAEVDNLLSNLTLGISHDIAVKSILTGALPATPAQGDAYIIDLANTDPSVAAHLGEVAIWDGTRWDYSPPEANETHLVEDVSQLWHWNGVGWVLIATGSLASNLPEGDFWRVGSIQQSVLTEAQFLNTMPATERSKWVLADGRDVTGTTYNTVTGDTHVPDLRGAYLRMAGTNAHAGRTGWVGGLLKSFQDWLTAEPKTPWTVSNPGNHHHIGGRYQSSDEYAATQYSRSLNRGQQYVNMNSVTKYNASLPYTSNEGNHVHTVTGGDAETRPASFAVNYFIKVG